MTATTWRAPLAVAIAGITGSAGVALSSFVAASLLLETELMPATGDPAAVEL